MSYARALTRTVPPCKHTGMSDNVLSLVEVEHSYGERAILDGLTLGIDRGAKVGLIGNNGAGKSTLLNVIGGVIAPDGGDIIMRSGEQLHFMHQVPDLAPDSTPREILEETLSHLIKAVRAYEEASANMSGEATALRRIYNWRNSSTAPSIR